RGGASATPPLARELTAENAADLWREAVDRCSGLAADSARQFERAAISAPNHLVVTFGAEYTLAKSVCERPENANRLRTALAEVVGRRVDIEFQIAHSSADDAKKSGSPSQVPATRRRVAEVAEHPLVRRAAELFGAEATQVTEPTKKPK
ncbi:MAG: hypothetical protein JW719_13950, partial [Pirellulales bacterium]|nr:hypothetical protein [Pirellulales bacterium]